MRTEEGNKLIAEFMGKSFKDPLNYMYDKSWDWLMPVVEKIEKEMFATTQIINMGCIIKCNDDNKTKIARFGNPKIEMTWLAVIVVQRITQ